MAVETIADRATFVDPDDFGIAIIYTPAGGSGAALNIIWDNPFEGLDLGGEASFEATKPEITLRDADLPAGHKNGDVLIIDSSNYKRTEYRPDGTGMGQMRLQKL